MSKKYGIYGSPAPPPVERNGENSKHEVENLLGKVPGNINTKFHYSRSIFSKYGILGGFPLWRRKVGDLEKKKKTKKKIFLGRCLVIYISKFTITLQEIRDKDFFLGGEFLPLGGGTGVTSIHEKNKFS